MSTTTRLASLRALGPAALALALAAPFALADDPTSAPPAADRVPPAGPALAPPMPTEPPAATAPATPTAASWGDGKVPRGSRPTATPARGAPYNLRQIGLGAAIMAVMLALVIWLVRRNTRGRRT